MINFKLFDGIAGFLEGLRSEASIGHIAGVPSENIDDRPDVLLAIY